jgi:hypothetical protein
MLKILPPEWIIDEELNINRLVYDIKNKSLENYRSYQDQVREDMSKIEKDLKVSDK